MKNTYEIYKYSVDKNGEYIVTVGSEYIEGYKKAKERLDYLRKTLKDKHFKIDMCKVEK